MKPRKNRVAPEVQLQLSNLALRHLVGEMGFLQNGFVNNVQSLEKGWMKVKVHTKQFGDKNLVLTQNAFFIAEQSIPAKQNPGGFSAFLKKHIYNQRIISIEQHGLDRIVVMEFPEVFLILELFAEGNLVLCNKEWEIIRAMRKEEWKDRKLEQREKYKFPSSRGANPLEENEKTFVEKMKENKKTSFGAAVDLLNLGPAILERIFEDLEIDKKKNAGELSAEQSKKILLKAKEVCSAKEGNISIAGGALYSTELPAALANEETKTFSSISSALNELLLLRKNQGIQREATEEISEKEVKVSKEDRGLAGIAAKEKQILALENETEELKKKGEEIYLHYSEIKEVLEAVKRGKAKEVSEKEILEKINANKILAKNINLKQGKVLICV